MELLFIWIYKYKGLSNVGLNFSNRYKFRFDPDSKDLSYEEAENYIPDFFSSNITNLTAVVGQNGTGKTTLLRYMMEYLSQGMHNHNDQNNILVFDDGQKFVYHGAKQLNFIENGRPSKRELRLDEISSRIRTAFISNIFNPTSFQAIDYSKLQYGETKNLSTEYLLFSDHFKRTGQHGLQRSVTFKDSYYSFARQESVRMVRLFWWLNRRVAGKKKFPVEVPPYMNFELIFNPTPFDKEIKAIIDYLEKTFVAKDDPKNRFIIKAFSAALYHWMYESEFTVGVKEVKELLQSLPAEIVKYLDGSTFEVNKKNSVVPYLHDIFYHLIGNTELQMLQSNLENVQRFFEYLGDFILRHKAEYLYDNDRIVLSIKMTSNTQTALQALVEQYYSVDRISGYLDFYFSHEAGSETSLSSGEYSLFSIFARLHTLSQQERYPLLLLIDEAELALHPQWQKEFLSYFVDFLKERFKSRKVQIVMTAHSPFILSDIPPNCVVLLQKGTDGVIVRDNLDDHIETFGANIHELFTHSFFLQDGLMGEFAREKIGDLIKDINERDFISESYFEENLKRQIDIIGESFLKSKLLEMVAERSDIRGIDKIIELRNTELERLRALRREKDDKDNTQ